MGVIFYSKYINNDADFKQVKHDIYDTLQYFCDFHDCNGYKNWKRHLE